MKQTQCPRCGKKRYKAAAGSTSSDKRWKYYTELKAVVCFKCAAEIDKQFQEQDEQLERE